MLFPLLFFGESGSLGKLLFLLLFKLFIISFSLNFGLNSSFIKFTDFKYSSFNLKI